MKNETTEAFRWLTENQPYMTASQRGLIKNVRRYYLLYKRLTNHQKAMLNEIIKFLDFPGVSKSSRPMFPMNEPVKSKQDV